ncbi:MAG: LolA family protein, partial [Flavobacteriales bacterium]
MKKTGILFLSLFITTVVCAQSAEKAKALLDEVSAKMGAYENMYIGFSQTLSNEEAGIKEGDEPPITGEINLKGEKYSLNYLGNDFIYDGAKLYVINHDEKEISISDSDLSDDDGFIYPSKLLTFYKEGYTLEMGKSQNIKGRNIQFVTLNPIDSNSEIIMVELGIDVKTYLQANSNRYKCFKNNVYNY